MSRPRVSAGSEFFAAFLAVAMVVATLAGGAGAASDAGRRHRYVVTLRPGADAAEIGRVSRAAGARPRHVYRHTVTGFAAGLTAAQARRLAGDPKVRSVERDGRVHVTVQALPWGVDRVEADVSSTRAGNGSGSVALDVYVIDTGAGVHRDLDVVERVDFTGSGNAADCHGHGTHVAGTIAARDDTNDVVGVAPGARIHALKVLGCDGGGWISDVMAAVDWTAANATRPAVANLSLGGSASTSFDDAVRRLAAAGIPVVVAAGNSSRDACLYSPARAGGGVDNGVVTVGATDSRSRAASFSNYGRCVDIWAPGVSIVSTRLGGGTSTMSGTSMASPHVAGAAALRLSSNPTAAAAETEAALRADAVSSRYRAPDRGAIRIVYAGRY